MTSPAVTSRTFVRRFGSRRRLKPIGRSDGGLPRMGQPEDRTPHFGGRRLAVRTSKGFTTGNGRTSSLPTGPNWQVSPALKTRTCGLHRGCPGHCVYNVATFEDCRTRSILSANLDPSHFFWMGMDGHKVAERIKSRVGHLHGKDTTFNDDNVGLNGVLDHRWPTSPELMPWNFSVVGRGHDVSWWAGLVTRLKGSQARVISIEHEDPFVPATVGVPEAARLLREAISLADHDGDQS